MKFSFESMPKESDIPVMNIEHNNNNYKLYVDYDDGYVRLIENSSTEFVSSGDVFYLENEEYGKKIFDLDKIFFENIFLFGSVYEVLNKAGINKDFSDVEERCLYAFIYASLFELQIESTEQWDYRRLLNNLWHDLLPVNSPKENLGEKLICFHSNEIYISTETQCIYFKTAEQKRVKFNYSKYNSIAELNLFLYNLIWVFLHTDGFSEDSSTTFEEFNDFINHIGESCSSNKKLKTLHFKRR